MYVEQNWKMAKREVSHQRELSKNNNCMTLGLKNIILWNDKLKLTYEDIFLVRGVCMLHMIFSECCPYLN